MLIYKPGDTSSWSLNFVSLYPWLLKSRMNGMIGGIPWVVEMIASNGWSGSIQVSVLFVRAANIGGCNGRRIQLSTFCL